MISALLHRLSSAATARPAAPRQQVCPPQPLRGGRRFARELREWLASGWSSRPHLPGRGAAAEATSPLAVARRDFIDAIDDIHGPQADRLTDRICTAVSLRDLWHLRIDVFALVAREFDQHEADTRLAQLSRHFPTRSPRSGFGALDGHGR